MAIPERFILWAGDGPLNAVDDIAGCIVEKIDEAIKECVRTDTCWLNETVAYMCCLSAVAHHYGGLIAQYDKVREWRTQVFEIHDAAWGGEERDARFHEERSYIETVVTSLFEAVDHSAIESEREKWLS